MTVLLLAAPALRVSEKRELLVDVEIRVVDALQVTEDARLRELKSGWGGGERGGVFVLVLKSF